MLVVDTDILIDILRKRPAALTWLAGAGAVPIVVPGYAAMEIYAGVRNAREQREADGLLALVQIGWPSTAHCEVALRNHRQFHLTHGTGPFDALIGQTAIEFGVPLHTFNVKHYAPIPGLTTIQPYTR